MKVVYPVCCGVDVCMESTGKYWVPVFNILEDENINITIANPKWVKAVKGNKDDKKDSKWIGDLFRFGLVPGSFIPAKPIRILRDALSLICTIHGLDRKTAITGRDLLLATTKVPERKSLSGLHVPEFILNLRWLKLPMQP